MHFLVYGAALGMLAAAAQGDTMTQQPWQAQWISAPIAAVPVTPEPSEGSNPRTTNLWTMHRKKFVLSARPDTAPARIAVDSRYWLWVNGKMVVFEGGLKRGPTPNDTWYDTLDLAPHLKKGTNTVAVLAWYWGKDGFSHKSSGLPGLLFECQAGAELIASDASWKAIAHPACEAAEGPEPNFRLSEFPVRYDARKDPGDWMSAAFDDSGWSHAREHGRPPVAPWNRLFARPIPFWKNSGLREYVNARSLPKVSTGEPVLARLPHNAQVTPWFRIEAPAGRTIEIRTDNPLNEIYAQYVTRDGVQEFECLSWMSGHAVEFRIPEGIKLLGLKYRETGYDAEFSGRFTCDQDFFNTLWLKAQRTLYITMRDNYMDCPDRERAQWWGDAVNELGEAPYALSPSSALLTRKAILDLIRWQRSDKTLFSPVPAGNWNKELPAQMLASVGKYGIWTYYLHTGDDRILKESYPAVREYLSVWKTDEKGLVIHRPGEWDWMDWGENIDARLLDNAWFCLALEGAALMADALGRSEEAQTYRDRRAGVRAAVNAHFWNGTEYRDPAYKGATDDRGQALCVVADITGSALFPAIRKLLASQYHASPYMEKYVLEALVLMGEHEAALERMRNRYQSFVTHPRTTLPEGWNEGTENHAWSGGPLTILSQYFAGIEPLTPGYATYQVRPRLGSLKKIHASVDSVRGRIDVKIERGDRRFNLALESPAKTSVVVMIPEMDGPSQRVRVNGKVLWDCGVSPVLLPGASCEGLDGGFVRFTVAPGSWRFEADRFEADR